MNPQSNNSIHSDLQHFYDQALDDSIDTDHDELISDSDRYSEWEEIGLGGMKKVYRVYDHKTSRYVALASLINTDNEEHKSAFLREARLTAMLEHPGIINLYDIGADSQGAPYFTLELKCGDSLDTVIKRIRQKETVYLERYPLTVRLEIFLRICEAIAYAHSRNILHLDLKPDNIQIGLFGEVQVCDWGLGKVIGQSELIEHSPDESLYEELTDVTIFGEIKGSPGYMAPRANA